MERIKAIQQEILQSDIFKKLGELESSTRLYHNNLPYKDVNYQINVYISRFPTIANFILFKEHILKFITCCKVHKGPLVRDSICFFGMTILWW
jgi:hypothetical protein